MHYWLAFRKFTIRTRLTSFASQPIKVGQNWVSNRQNEIVVVVIIVIVVVVDPRTLFIQNPSFKV